MRHDVLIVARDLRKPKVSERVVVEWLDFALVLQLLVGQCHFGHDGVGLQEDHQVSSW